MGHVDLDYFYAQVEEVIDPSLKVKPVLVCVFSGRTEDSGVVATANYRARALGIRSGMPIVSARKRLQGIDSSIIRMQREKYVAVSQRVMKVIEGEVDVLEQTGIDEAFFDLTSSSGGDFSRARDVGAQVKRSVFESEGLTCSVGIGQSKVVAKVASDFQKPDGLTVVVPESTDAFLRPLPVTSLYGVGPKVAESLGALGIKTVGELSAASPGEIEMRFGRRQAAYFLAAAKGADEDPVSPRVEPTQYSRIVTLKQNTRDAQVAFGRLAGAVEDVHRQLGARGASFRTITVIGILSDLTMKTKSKTFEAPLSDLGAMQNTTRGLLAELSAVSEKEFRRVGVRVTDLVSCVDQASLTQYFQ